MVGRLLGGSVPVYPRDREGAKVLPNMINYKQRRWETEKSLFQKFKAKEKQKDHKLLE